MTKEISKGSNQAQDVSAVPAGKATSRRRGFLVGVGVAAGAAGVAAVALGSRSQQAAGDALPQASRQAPVDGRGYQETAHVRKYYDTTKV